MEEVYELIRYAKLCGFSLTPNGDKLRVKNGANLPKQLKRLLTIYKDEILEVLKDEELYKKVS